MKNKKVFISHPFSDDEKNNKIKVDKICKNIIKEEKVLPISPLHLWSFLSSDKGVRSVIMDFCFKMISYCNEIRFYVYGEMSKGQLEEYNWALKENKSIIIIDMR